MKNLESMNLMYPIYKSIRASGGLPVLLHWRKATHGEISTENCHPFFYNSNTVFAHNGVIKMEGMPDDQVDTIAFRDRILIERLPVDWIGDKYYQQMVESFIGTSKLVFLDGDGNVTILNADKGVWDKNNWFSNTTFRYIKRDRGYQSNWATLGSAYLHNRMHCMYCDEETDHHVTTCSDFNSDLIGRDDWITYLERYAWFWSPISSRYHLKSCEDTKVSICNIPSTDNWNRRDPIIADDFFDYIQKASFCGACFTKAFSWMDKQVDMLFEGRIEEAFNDLLETDGTNTDTNLVSVGSVGGYLYKGQVICETCMIGSLREAEEVYSVDDYYKFIDNTRLARCDYCNSVVLPTDNDQLNLTLKAGASD